MPDGTMILAGLALGLAAGVLGGMFGIGGGLVIVPGLVLLFAQPIKTATGTSLVAQLLPVGLLGVAAYYRRGEVRFDLGLSISAGLFLGMLGGALVAGQIPAPLMKRLYGIFLLAVAAYFILSPQGVKERVGAKPQAPASGAGQEVH